MLNVCVDKPLGAAVERDLKMDKHPIFLHVNCVKHYAARDATHFSGEAGMKLNTRRLVLAFILGLSMTYLCTETITVPDTSWEMEQ